MKRLIQQREEKIVKEIIVPELAESITEGTIAEWLVKPGEKVQKGDPVCELETDKVNVEINSDYTGVIVELLAEEGDDVAVGQAIARVDESGEAGATVESAAEAAKEEPKAEAKQEVQDDKQEEAAPAAASLDVIATPAARKLAREKGIDLASVQASDPLGRIRPQDVEAASQRPKQPAPQAPAQQAPSAAPQKPYRRERMSRRRQTIAKRLVEAQHTAAMLTTFNEVDMSAVINLRKERQEEFVKKHGVKLGFMSFFTKAVVAALKEFPLLNAEIDGKDLIIKEFYDIGI